MKRQARWSTWRWPLLLAAATSVGLILALVEDNILGQLAGWIGLALPLGTVVLRTARIGRNVD